MSRSGSRMYGLNVSQGGISLTVGSEKIGDMNTKTAKPRVCVATIVSPTLYTSHYLQPIRRIGFEKFHGDSTQIRAFGLIGVLVREKQDLIVTTGSTRRTNYPSLEANAGIVASERHIKAGWRKRTE